LRVEIPFSFQSFDLGIIPPSAVIELTYILDIFSDDPVAPESVFWQFSDPGNVSGFGDFPAVEFTPIPEPSSFSLAALGLLGIGYRRRKRT
jgi:hypothetical protein